MSNQTNQVIPDPNAVVRYLDQSSPGASKNETFVISDLLESIKDPTNEYKSFAHHLNQLIIRTKLAGKSNEACLRTVEQFVAQTINEEPSKEAASIFGNGLDCQLLQLDGKGWKKGILKICLEFIPEKDEPVDEPTLKLTETEKLLLSPLDEIRQSLIEQN